MFPYPHILLKINLEAWNTLDIQPGRASSLISIPEIEAMFMRINPSVWNKRKITRKVDFEGKTNLKVVG